VRHRKFPRRQLRALNAAERHWVPRCFLPSAAAGYGVPPNETARRRAPASERHHVPKSALPRATVPRAAEHRRAAAGAGRRRAPLNATERRKSLLGHASTAAPPRALSAAEHRCMPPSTAVCHRAPPSVAAAHATERRHAAAGSAHRRALRSANVEDREMGAALCARSRRGRTTARVCAATNPPSSIPPFSPTDRSRYATLKADQVPGDNCCGGVTTEVVSRHGSRPGCNPRRQGGDNFWT